MSKIKMDQHLNSTSFNRATTGRQLVHIDFPCPPLHLPWEAAASDSPCLASNLHQKSPKHRDDLSISQPSQVGAAWLPHSPRTPRGPTPTIIYLSISVHIHHLPGGPGGPRNAGAVLRSLTLPTSGPGDSVCGCAPSKHLHELNVLLQKFSCSQCSQCSQASADLTQSSGSGNLCSPLRFTMCYRNLDQMWRIVEIWWSLMKFDEVSCCMLLWGGWLNLFGLHFRITSSWVWQALWASALSFKIMGDNVAYGPAVP